MKTASDLLEKLILLENGSETYPREKLLNTLAISDKKSSIDLLKEVITDDSL